MEKWCEEIRSCLLYGIRQCPDETHFVVKSRWVSFDSIHQIIDTSTPQTTEISVERCVDALYHSFCRNSHSKSYDYNKNFYMFVDSIRVTPSVPVRSSTTSVPVRSSTTSVPTPSSSDRSSGESDYVDVGCTGGVNDDDCIPVGDKPSDGPSVLTRPYTSRPCMVGECIIGACSNRDVCFIHWYYKPDQTTGEYQLPDSS